MSEEIRKIVVFDTTLRDGEQSPGASMNIKEKLEVARQLARLGVDVMEAGFPISSPGDFEAVKAVAETVQGPVVAGLARAKDIDIEAAGKAVVKTGASIPLSQQARCTWKRNSACLLKRSLKPQSKQ